MPRFTDPVAAVTLAVSASLVLPALAPEALAQLRPAFQRLARSAPG
jgi:hypothetical protein